MVRLAAGSSGCRRMTVFLIRVGGEQVHGGSLLLVGIIGAPKWACEITSTTYTVLGIQ